jgi:hypothetical protein
MVVVLPDEDGSLDRLAVAGLLIRPDRYILASAIDASAVDALLDKLNFANPDDRANRRPNVEPDENADGARPVLAAG